MTDRPKRHGAGWNNSENSRLYDESVSGLDIQVIADLHQRSYFSILAKQKTLGLRGEDDELKAPLPIIEALPFDYLGVAEREAELLPKVKVEASTKLSPALKINSEGETTLSPVTIVATKTRTNRPSSPPIFKVKRIPKLNEAEKDKLKILFLVDEAAFFESLRDSLITHIQGRVFTGDLNHKTNIRMQDILLSRLGMNSDAPSSLTLADLGEKYGVSRERIRQIQNSALKKLNFDLGRTLDTSDYLKVIVKAKHDRLSDIALGKVLIALDETDFTWTLKKVLGEWATRISDNSHDAESVANYVSNFFDTIRKTKRSIAKAERHAHKEAKVLRERCEKAGVIVTAILDRSHWPAPVETSARLPFPRTALRAVNTEMCLYSEKLGRDVEYESGAEKSIFTALEYCDDVARYTEQPYKIPYLLWNMEKGYFPDCIVEFRDGRQLVIEVKGTNAFAAYRTLTKARAARKALENFGIGYALVDRSGHGLEQVTQQKISIKLENDLLKLINNYGEILWPDIVNNIETVPSITFQIQAIVLKHKLFLDLFPMRLRRLKPDEDNSIFDYFQ